MAELEPDLDATSRNSAAWQLAKLQYLNQRRAILMWLAQQDKLFDIDTRKGLVVVISEN